MSGCGSAALAFHFRVYTFNRNRQREVLSVRPRPKTGITLVTFNRKISVGDKGVQLLKELRKTLQSSTCQRLALPSRDQGPGEVPMLPPKAETNLSREDSATTGPTASGGRGQRSSAEAACQSLQRHGRSFWEQVPEGQRGLRTLGSRSE